MAAALQNFLDHIQEVEAAEQELLVEMAVPLLLAVEEMVHLIIRFGV